MLSSITDAEFGLKLGALGRNEAVLEVGMLLVAGLIAYRNGDLREALFVERRNALMGIPLIALATLTILYANENSTHLLEYGFASSSLTLISVSHILLACVLAFSMLRGINGLAHRKIKMYFRWRAPLDL